MATSIYIYDSMKTYKKVMGSERNDPLRECELIDLYIKKDKLYVITNTSMHKEQPRLERTIVHFRNGKIGEWKSGKETLVTYGNLRYNSKNDKLELFPRFLRKPELDFKVGRFYGDLTCKKPKIDYTNRFYDLQMDRISLILEEKNEVS